MDDDATTTILLFHDPPTHNPRRPHTFSPVSFERLLRILVQGNRYIRSKLDRFRELRPEALTLLESVQQAYLLQFFCSKDASDFLNLVTTNNCLKEELVTLTFSAAMAEDVEWFLPIKVAERRLYETHLVHTENFQLNLFEKLEKKRFVAERGRLSKTVELNSDLGPGHSSNLKPNSSSSKKALAGRKSARLSSGPKKGSTSDQLTQANVKTTSAHTNGKQRQSSGSNSGPKRSLTATQPALTNRPAKAANSMGRQPSIKTNHRVSPYSTSGTHPTASTSAGSSGLTTVLETTRFFTPHELTREDRAHRFLEGMSIPSGSDTVEIVASVLERVGEVVDVRMGHVSEKLASMRRELGKLQEEVEEMDIW